MATITILHGDSGRWQGHVGALPVWGHIPRQLWHSREWEAVCRRQIRRQIGGEVPQSVWPRLQGGYREGLEVPEEWFPAAEAEAARREAVRRQAHAADLQRLLANGDILCPVCGGSGRAMDVRLGHETRCYRCGGLGAVWKLYDWEREAQPAAGAEHPGQ